MLPLVNLTSDEFKEYKAVIQGALDFVKFNERVDIHHQHLTGIHDAIMITSTRCSRVVIIPAGHIFNVGWTQSTTEQWTTKEINLAIPDSLEILGTILKRALGPPWAI